MLWRRTTSTRRGRRAQPPSMPPRSARTRRGALHGRRTLRDTQRPRSSFHDRRPTRQPRCSRERSSALRARQPRARRVPAHPRAARRPLPRDRRSAAHLPGRARPLGGQDDLRQPSSLPHPRRRLLVPKLHLDWSDGRYYTRVLSDEEAAESEKHGGTVVYLEDTVYEGYKRDSERDAIWQAFWRAICNEQYMRRREAELQPLESAEREIARRSEERRVGK